jgi:hypothetical protein
MAKLTMDRVIVKDKGTTTRAFENVMSYKLYVPNSFSYGAEKALDLFANTYAYGALVCRADKVAARSYRRTGAVMRKSMRDWNVLSNDFSAALKNCNIIFEPVITKSSKEKLGTYVRGTSTRKLKQ